MVSGYGKVIGMARIKVKIFDITRNVFVFVLNTTDFSHDFLIGLDLITEFKLCQDENLNIFQKRNNRGVFCPSNILHSSKLVCVNSVQLKADLSHLNFTRSSSVSKVIQKFNHVFAKNTFDIGTVSAHEAAVKLSEHRYVYRKPYRCNIIDQKEIENQISELLKAGLIEESTSPFAAPVTLAFRKHSDGSRKKNRMCIDYSYLNKLVVPESQPFPLIEDLIVKARDCQWFSVLDINSAFWSIPLREKDRYKTAFVTQTGHYNWKCMPFGLKTSPAIFQRILRNTLKKHDLDDFAVNYIDDILVFSKSFEQHLVHLEKILDAIYKAGFRLNLSKCNFAKNKVKYLGHEIENNLTRPIFDNVLPVRDFPVPKTQKNVRQFLGKVNFYHSYIPNSAIILAPLHNLLKKNIQFEWNDSCQKSFEFVKDCLCREPCLAIFSPDKETVVYTDASLEGIGAVLKQRQEDGTFKPVAYFSKKLNECQKKKKALFLECLAIKEALNYWRYRLLGISFEIVTDHKPLENMKINTKFDDELRELILQISQFDYKVTYKPGKTNLEADCLSRNPVLNSQEASSELRVVNFLAMEDLLKDQKSVALDRLNKKINVINKENNLLFTTCKNTKKIIISDEFARELVKKAHFHFGHIGVKQLELTLLPYFYNESLKKLILEFTKTCSTCLRNKSRISPKFGPMSHLGPATKPFEYMSVDTIGGFSGNNSTKRYIHLLVDHFTRFAYAITSKHQKAPDFIKLLNLAIQKGNNVTNLLADQYTGLNSSIFKQFLKQHNVRLLFTAVDCPFSNGINERLNQTLVNRLRCKVNEKNINKTKPWPILFDECLNEYNNTIHSATKFSPNYLMNGVHPPILNTIKRQSNINLEKDRKLAFLNSQKNHFMNKKRYDRFKREPEFQVGQLVLVHHGNSLNRNKLDEIRTGPYKILARISNCLFEVDSGYQKKESNIYHVSKMFPFQP
ncbi:hypothetical protein V9T40_008613 [Parthenolecanium corni]|uniref:RNA-directed DNA polymerase n=1 Tax=Parthenolecanium corni TaxID=536013 RepID=A0AAN9Y818_9HEMI